MPEPDIERRSLNKLETTTFLTGPPQAGPSACEAPLQRSWSKPAYEKKKGVDQKIRQRDKRREKRSLKRESEKHCVSYTKHGLCKLGESCRFRHVSGIKHEGDHRDMVMRSLHNVDGAAHPYSKARLMRGQTPSWTRAQAPRRFQARLRTASTCSNTQERFTTVLRATRWWRKERRS